MDIFNNSPEAKFEESLDVSIKLGIDPEKSDQNVRGATSLPSGSGKSCKVAVFVEGDLAKDAKEAGADAVGMDDLVKKLKENQEDFDVIIATPDIPGPEDNAYIVISFKPRIFLPILS